MVRASDQHEPTHDPTGTPALSPAVQVDDPEVLVTAGSFDDFYRAERRAVLGLAWTLCGDRSLAEELTQDAFMAAHRKWQVISGYEDPGGFVRRVVANRSVSAIRRRTAEARALVRVGNRRSDQSREVDLPDDAFWAAVRALPDRQAQAIALHYLEDRSVGDIAAILEIATSTVKVHLHRGRQTLAETLGTSREGTNR
jgi:RNA polymerase sigma-70 factor (ECF subfamily)